MTKKELEQCILDTSIKILFFMTEENSNKPEHLKRSEYYIVRDSVSILAEELYPDIEEE